MVKIIKLDDNEYEVETLSHQAKATLAYFEFANTRLQELKNMQALLGRAKNSYVESIKREMISDKAGLLLGNE